MIDSHCHLNLIDKRWARGSLTEEAVAAGVCTIINVGTDLKTSEESIRLAEESAAVYATVGVHPHDAGVISDAALTQMKAMAGHKKVVAIGEIGLDYYRDLAPRDVQRTAFHRQMDLAVELKKPVVIHTREAFDDTVKIIREYRGRLNGGVFHCFPGDIQDAYRVIDMGFMIAYGGVITYKNSVMSAVAKAIPLEYVLLETDAPYLAPMPFRGKVNRPANVKLVYEKLAYLKKLNIREIESIVDRNCGKLFGLVETLGG